MPADASSPTDPAEPTEASEPTEPAEPSEPTEPTKPGELRVLPVLGVPEIDAGDDVGAALVRALRTGPGLHDGDVLVVSAKLFSKSLDLRAPATHKAAHVLAESRRVVAERRTPTGLTRVVESLAGPVLVAAGIDASNTGADDTVLLLPREPDRIARELHTTVCEQLGVSRVGVVLSDTAGRPWRHGQTDFALGAAGLVALDDLRGATDRDGRPLAVTAVAVADEIAGAADLVRPKAAGVAAAVVRDLPTRFVPDLGAGEAGATPVATSVPTVPAVPAVPTDPAKPAERVRTGRGLVRAGPDDWFALGHVEAVRAALGVAPGTPEALDVGVPAVGADEFGDRIDRACRLALQDAGVGDVPADHPRAPLAHRPIQLRGVRCDVVQQGVNLSGTDELTLGVAAARLLVALAAEGLQGRIAAHTPPARPGAPARVHVVLL